MPYLLIAGKELLKKANSTARTSFKNFNNFASAMKHMGYNYQDYINTQNKVIADYKPNPDMIDKPTQYSLPIEPELPKWPYKK